MGHSMPKSAGLRAEAREIQGNIPALQAQADRKAPNEVIEDAMTWIRAENLGRPTEGDAARAEAREAVHTAQRAEKLAEAAELAKKLVPIASARLRNRRNGNACPLRHRQTTTRGPRPHNTGEPKCLTIEAMKG